MPPPTWEQRLGGGAVVGHVPPGVPRHIIARQLHRPERVTLAIAQLHVDGGDEGGVGGGPHHGASGVAGLEGAVASHVVGVVVGCGSATCGGVCKGGVCIVGGAGGGRLFTLLMHVK